MTPILIRSPRPGTPLDAIEACRRCREPKGRQYFALASALLHLQSRGASPRAPAKHRPPRVHALPLRRRESGGSRLKQLVDRIVALGRFAEHVPVTLRRDSRAGTLYRNVFGGKRR